MALDDFTNKMKNNKDESSVLSEQDKKAIIGEISNQIENRNPLVQQKNQTVQVLVQPLMDPQRRQQVIQSTQMMGTEALDDTRRLRDEQTQSLREDMKKKRGEKKFARKFEKYNEGMRDNLDEQMDDFNEKLSELSLDQYEDLQERLAMASEGTFVRLTDIKENDAIYDQHDDKRLDELKKHDDKNLKTHMQHDRQLANTRLSLFDKLGNFFKLSMAIATGGISTFVLGFKKRKNLQQITANEEIKQTDILSRMLQEMQATRVEAELNRLQQLEKDRELTRAEKRKLAQLQMLKRSREKADFEGEKLGIVSQLAKYFGQSPILKKLGLVGAQGVAGYAGMKMAAKGMEGLKALPKPGDGTFRDKQGRLRNQKGQFVKEAKPKPAKQVAKGLTKQGAKTTGKAITKSAIKKIPLIGLLAGAGFGIDRLLKGDIKGAGLEVASGAAGMVPGVGTAGSVGIDAALLARDLEKQKQETEKLKEEVEKPEIKPREYTMLEKLTMDMATTWNKTIDSLETAADKLKDVSKNLDIFNSDENDPKKRTLFQKFLMKTDEVNDLAKEYYEDIKDKTKKTTKNVRGTIAPMLETKSALIQNSHENAMMKEMARTASPVVGAGNNINAPVTNNTFAPVHQSTYHTTISRRNNEHSYQRTMDRLHPRGAD